MGGNEIVEHDREANACLSDSSGGPDLPPTEAPVVASPNTKLRRFRKNCDTQDTQGKKIRPVAIPIPTP
jgi:hypothetical protein